MKNLQYKKVTTTTLKVGGILDADRMVIDVDGVEKDIKTLLSDFDGACVELNVKVKDEMELEEPSDSDSDEYDM